MSLATKLLHAIITKTLLEVLVVCGLVAFAAYRHFNPQLRGAVDAVDAQRVAGWALDARDPEAVVDVQLFIDGKFVTMKKADERREDVMRAGLSSQPFHGFSFSLSDLPLDSGNHEAQVYAISAASEKFKAMHPLSARPRLVTIR